MRHTSRLLVQCTRLSHQVDSHSSHRTPRVSHFTDLPLRLSLHNRSSSRSRSRSSYPRPTPHKPKSPGTPGLVVCQPHRAFPNDLVSVLLRSIRSSCSRCTWATSHHLVQKHNLYSLHRQTSRQSRQLRRQKQQQQQQQQQGRLRKQRRKPKRTSPKTPVWYILTMKSAQRKNWPVCPGMPLLLIVWGKPPRKPSRLRVVYPAPLGIPTTRTSTRRIESSTLLRMN